MFVSLVAHAVGYKVIVGAHNTVDVRRMWEVLPCSTRYGKMIAGKLLLVVVIHSLGGSCANWHHRPNPQ